MELRKKIRLGDLLVENKIISQKQLEAALTDQKRSGRKLGRVLVDNGYIDEPALLEFLSQQLNIPFIDLKSHKFEPRLLQLLPEMQARRYRALVLAEVDGQVLVGMADPTDIFAHDELSRIIKRPLREAVVSEAQLLRTFDNVYRRTEAISAFAEKLDQELSRADVDLDSLTVSDDVADAPAVRLIETLFQDAAQIRASDIHIEPDESVLRIRLRVDGVLQEQVMDEKRIAPALVVRLKLMSGLDISEKRLPQDGRFSITVGGKRLDVRISTMPVQYGESVVLRLLDQSAGLLGLEELGMPAPMRARFEGCIANPHGMVLVTGPTGSGKTTTLYAAVNLLNRAEAKIITVEDPVEYRLPRVNQVQVHQEIGLSYARVLRAVLRQDPDVVLVGEMRDEETAEIGLRAAMTGHLVLSTLHTNDAASTVTRLLDMGAEGYLVGSALRAVVAQRLVRRVCPECAQATELQPHERRWLDQLGPAARPIRTEQRGGGCSDCNHTGYRGRVGIYELLVIDPALQAVLAGGVGREFVEHAQQRLRGQRLVDAALAQVQAGRTTIEEAMRTAGGHQELERDLLEPVPAAVAVGA